MEGNPTEKHPLAKKYTKDLDAILKETANTKIELPSQGKVYSKDNILSKGHVHIRYMRGEDEEVLLSPTHIKENTFLEALLEKVVLEPDFNVYDLTEGDKLYLVLSSRIMSLGSKFTIPEVTCPNCEKVHENVEFDVEQIQERDILHEPVEPNSNKFQTELPHSNDVVTLQSVTGHLEQEMIKKANKMAEMGTGEYTISHRVADLLVDSTGMESSSGAPQFGQKLKYIRNLHIKDSQAIRKFLSEINGVPDTTIPFKCENKRCGYNIKVPVQFGITFFFPNV